MLTHNQIITDWNKHLTPEFQKDYFQKLSTFLLNEAKQGKTIFPENNKVFAAMNETPLELVKVVILGQDPYPTPGHAHGLSFSVEPDVTPLPRSLTNIYKELTDDLGIMNETGNLMSWAQQGVLLLNTTLTVESGAAGSHAKKGWETFTDRIIELINQEKEHVVFVLWGGHAQKKGKKIDRNKHYVIETAHPSPLSVYRGFWGSKPFSKINNYLQSTGQTPINWKIK
ncbi:uracil-DNA glycosylase (plasmid) [Methylomarinum sp. Ch1-1]|uniref:Uracil-DNA glycosylase n=1 Tax=Methylomarinum roseum TaxID=3067653 RepID=A0AAU7P0R6_9GAMM|nr:uracil-DNA glycosylase [Methylomarinum sp. Ch1-1]MDP4518950.1 uracil-DNA glycosylase [Methylomarinum sp. Ch1-1]MDP4523350.1 uracil-DNA glycosylase [Methylomarinum sp. Ch1-1]